MNIRPVLTSLAVLGLLAGCVGGSAATQDVTAAASAPAEAVSDEASPAATEGTDATARTAARPSATLPPRTVETPRAPLARPNDAQHRATGTTGASGGPVDVEGTQGEAPAEDPASAAARAALAPILDRIPADGAAWDLAASDLSAFDATQPTSWVVLATGTTDPMRQVVLFHHGIPTQTAFAHPFAGIPKFQRQGQDAVAVTYFYEENGAARPEWGTLARLTYTWDAAAAHFLVEGTIDGDPAMDTLGAHALSADLPEPLPVAGAAAGARGPIPLGASHAATDVSGMGAVLAAEDLGIECVVGLTDAACAVAGPVGTWTTATLDDARTNTGAAVTPGRSLRPTEGEAGTALADGTLVHYGPYVFAREGDAVTAWNSLTGRGFLLADAAATPLG